MFRIGEERHVVDGVHRALGMDKVGLKKIKVLNIFGSSIEAAIYASLINFQNGFRPSERDCYKILQSCKVHGAIHQDYADSHIYYRTSVCAATVVKFRKENDWFPTGPKVLGRNGRWYPYHLDRSSNPDPDHDTNVSNQREDHEYFGGIRQQIASAVECRPIVDECADLVRELSVATWGGKLGQLGTLILKLDKKLIVTE